MHRFGVDVGSEATQHCSTDVHHSVCTENTDRPARGNGVSQGVHADTLTRPLDGSERTASSRDPEVGLESNPRRPHLLLPFRGTLGWLLHNCIENALENSVVNVLLSVG